MIRRLVDAHYSEFQEVPNDEQVRFWLRESRTPEVLVRLAVSHPDLFREISPQRPLLTEALAGSISALEEELHREQTREKEADAAYWQPLKRELEILRAAKRSSG